jgi:hypothetical protein
MTFLEIFLIGIILGYVVAVWYARRTFKVEPPQDNNYHCETIAEDDEDDVKEEEKTGEPKPDDLKKDE